jgi:alpha-L-rhamnosidase
LFWGVLLGIRGPDYYGPRPLAPGFARVEICPQVVGDLTAAAGTVNTVHGRVAVAWERDGEQLTLEVSVPPGMRGTVSVPTLGRTEFRIEEHGSPVWRQDGAAASPVPWPVAGIAGAALADGAVSFDVGSGDYKFAMRGGTG